MDTGILLESGTNELEILEFMIGKNHYGINVAKIREILPYTKAVPIPNSDPAIEGIFMPRDEIITSIDLAKVLNLAPSDHPETDYYVVTYFNHTNAAFHIHQVIGISRVSWADIQKPDATISSGSTGIATGIVKLGDKLVVLLDFEKIVADISPETSLKVDDVKKLGERVKSDKPILIAEDSALLLKLIQDCLHEAGYTNLICTTNGQEAYDTIRKFVDDGTIEKSIKLIITDIEMPMMDGHRLTKLVKDDKNTSFIPIILFSSMISDELRKKGESLGADAQITKPEIGKLVGEIDKLIL